MTGVVTVGAGDVSGLDATEALQFAMNTAVAAGRPLLLDPITYTVSKTLMVPNGLVMTAHTPSGYGIPVEPHTKIALAAGTNDHLLRGGPDVAHVRITGVHFDGNKNNNSAGDIIHLDEASPREAQWHIRDCFIEAGANHGIYVGGGRRCVQISDCTLNYNRQYGARLNGSDGHVDRCIVGTNGEGGIGIGGTVMDVHACDIYNNKTGITVFSTLTKVTIRGNRIDKHTRQGILVNLGCRDVLIAHNNMHGNTVNINDNSGSSTVIKSDNIFSTE